MLKEHKKDSNPIVYNLDAQDDGIITERAVDSFESCGSNLNTRIAKLVNKYSTASNSGSATAIHTGTTIQCPNPRNATTLVGASGSGPSPELRLVFPITALPMETLMLLLVIMLRMTIHILDVAVL